MRLEQLAELEGEGVDIEWKSFLLRPEPQERDPEKFAEYTRSWTRPASIEPAAKFNTPWSGEHAPPSHSMPAAIAGKVAATFGLEAAKAYHQHLLDAYFVDNRTVSELEVLFDIAEEAGLDREEFASTFADQRNQLALQVIADHNEAIESGVTGVPAVVVDGKYLVPGAVDLDQYQRVVAHAREERANASQGSH